VITQAGGVCWSRECLLTVGHSAEGRRGGNCSHCFDGSRTHRRGIIPSCRRTAPAQQLLLQRRRQRRKGSGRQGANDRLGCRPQQRAAMLHSVPQHLIRQLLPLFCCLPCCAGKGP
jgi:hypothetical protein